MVTHTELINAIVAKMVSTIGKEKAVSSAGVKLSDDGTFSGKATLKDLTTVVENYNKIAGSVANILMKGAISSLIDGQDIELPEQLR